MRDKEMVCPNAQTVLQLKDIITFHNLFGQIKTQKTSDKKYNISRMQGSNWFVCQSEMSNILRLHGNMQYWSWINTGKTDAHLSGAIGITSATWTILVERGQDSGFGSVCIYLYSVSWEGCNFVSTTLSFFWFWSLHSRVSGDNKIDN